jgi:hypothetical protein
MAQTWAFVAAGAVQQNASSVVVPVPVGYAVGNLLVICVATSAAVSTPSGWTAISTNGAYTSAFWKFASASESSVTIAVTSGAAVMLCYSGINSADTAATRASGASAPAITNTQTTTADFDLVISMYGGNIASGTYSFSTPASTTSRASATPTLTSSALLVVDEAKTPAGVTTARSASGGVVVAWGALAFSFKQGSRASGNMTMLF